MSNPYRIHAFVCTKGKRCPTQGSEEVWLELRQKVRESGRANEIRVSKSGCMGQCGHGPMACVYPDNVWYGALTAGDVDALMDHLVEGTVHEPRVYAPPAPGPNKLPRE
ncbi:MAG: (2Fe-2S) ferredoxin domain-containing protein [Planctomycetota bacterium]